MPNPPPRAPTFPKFIDQEIDDLDFATPPRTMDAADRFAPENIPTPDTPDMQEVSASISQSIASSTTRTASAMSDSTSSAAAAAVPVVPLPTAHRKSVIGNILLWRQPKVTAVYFGGAMTFFFLTLIRGQEPLSVSGILFAVYQVTGIIVVKVNRQFLKGKLDKYINRPPEGTPLFRQDVANRWASIIVEEGNDIQHTLRDVMYCDKPPVVAACALVGLIIYALGSKFSFLGLFFVGTLMLFSLPLVYDRNKKHIDDTVAKAADSINRQIVMGQKIASDKAAELLENAPPAARDMASRVGLSAKPKSS